jgi:hypothetical protein
VLQAQRLGRSSERCFEAHPCTTENTSDLLRPADLHFVFELLPHFTDAEKDGLR